MKKEHSNGATASYYEIPAGATQLQDLISDRDMNAQIGEVFRACYRYGRVSHSDLEAVPKSCRNCRFAGEPMSSEPCIGCSDSSEWSPR